MQSVTVTDDAGQELADLIEALDDHPDVQDIFTTADDT
jgi:transcriptional/translational regulatory protein YebC/TACO1